MYFSKTDFHRFLELWDIFMWHSNSHSCLITLASELGLNATKKTGRKNQMWILCLSSISPETLNQCVCRRAKGKKIEIIQRSSQLGFELQAHSALDSQEISSPSSKWANEGAKSLLSTCAYKNVCVS